MKNEIYAIVLAGIVAISGVAIANEQLPKEDARAQFREQVTEVSENWILRYGSDGRIHITFLNDDVNTEVVCDVASRVEGFTLDTVTTLNGPNIECN